MATKNQRTSRLHEKMKVLKTLIDDGKLSSEKLIELQMEYCYLQREHKLMKERGES